MFHVDGLNTGEDARRPFFLQKEDLDYAVESATQKKLQRDRQALKGEIEILKNEAKEARLLVRSTWSVLSTGVIVVLGATKRWTSVAELADDRSESRYQIRSTY